MQQPLKWVVVERVLKGRYFYNFATQEVTSLRSLFPKALENYGSLSFYGPNIVVSEHEEWKKYKKIAAPAFSEVSSSLLVFQILTIHIDISIFPSAQQQIGLGGDRENHA